MKVTAWSSSCQPADGGMRVMLQRPDGTTVIDEVLPCFAARAVR